ncbi:olfactory receptor 52N4-like [Rhinophrynus dorsalis]
MDNPGPKDSESDWNPRAGRNAHLDIIVLVRHVSNNNCGQCFCLSYHKNIYNLHQPMDLFLSMLLITDFVQSNTALPKMLLLFWFKLTENSFEECLVQMFFSHSFYIMGSTVLVTLAFDRYEAICHPLRYSSILTNSIIMKMGLLRPDDLYPSSLLLSIPEIWHSFSFIYPSPSVQKNLATYQKDSLIEHIISNLYLIIPPIMNPIIYGIKTKQICTKVLPLICPLQL